MNEMIKRLMGELGAATERREAAVAARKAILDAAEADEKRALTEPEDAEFRAKTTEIAEADEEIRTLTARVDELEAEEKRAAAARSAAARVGAYSPAKVTSEELTYRKANGNSYIRDLANGLIMSDPEARERLARHANEVKLAPEFAEVRAGLDRGDGNGGFFVPPAWLMSQWIELARPGRPTANLIRSQALPSGTDSINIPRVKAGTQTAVQTADGNAVNEQLLQDDSISIPVRTVAGQQTIAQQLLDQSPLNFDEIVFRDLLADYAVKVDVQVLKGAGTNGEVTGFLTQTGTTQVTASANTGIGVYSAIANAVQKIHTSRFQSPSVIAMTPGRWAWFQTQVDSAGRPLVLPRAYNPMNNLGNVTDLAPQGAVGDILGLPVVLDPNLGSAGTEPILVLRPEDDLLYESSIRTRVLPEIKAQNLQVVIQAFGYLAFSSARYPVSTAVVNGLTAPTF